MNTPNERVIDQKGLKGIKNRSVPKNGRISATTLTIGGKSLS
jgi:hypothetical protein